MSGMEHRHKAVTAAQRAAILSRATAAACPMRLPPRRPASTVLPLLLLLLLPPPPPRKNLPHPCRRQLFLKCPLYKGCRACIASILYRKYTVEEVSQVYYVITFENVCHVLSGRPSSSPPASPAFFGRPCPPSEQLAWKPAASPPLPLPRHSRLTSRSTSH